MLKDVSVDVTSPARIHSPVTFSVSNVPNITTSISWIFGDGARRDNLTVSNADHTFIYPGIFTTEAQLCGHGLCHSIRVKVSKLYA